MDQEEKINLLLLKLENLTARQQNFEAEINLLKQEIRHLQFPTEEPYLKTTASVTPATIFPPKNTPYPAPKIQSNNFTAQFKRSNITKSDFEKFIGENLISKIGILILVIGVFIGTKFAIDKGLVSPLTRIILGYAFSLGLTGLAIKLKPKYLNFSAVLLSGAITMMYFITYAAYDFYALIPQFLAFSLMVIFTIFTVIAATKYNQQVIAHIGLVGAYAIPFLLSNGSGNFQILFTYIAIINMGILVLAFKKYWKPLFYVSFAITWIIFLAWRIPLNDGLSYLKVTLLFTSIYFFTFYITNLAYKVILKEMFYATDVTLLLLNSFIFYGIGYYAFSQSPVGAPYIGLFTLGNAIIHFVVSLFVYKRKLADKNLFYFILALVITFITMAVPVQLNGNWVTIFWAVEAAILYYLGRMKNISIYEKLSFVLVFLAFGSLLQDWAINTSYFNYNAAYKVDRPFFNVGFLSACIFIAAFGLMTWVNFNSKNETETHKTLSIKQILTYAVPCFLLFTIYYTFRLEIGLIYEQLYQSTKVNTTPNAKIGTYVYNNNIIYLKTASIYIYSLFFVAVLTLINLKKVKNVSFASANVVLNSLVILVFLTHGLFNLSELREIYIYQNDKYFVSGTMNIVIRYISLLFFAFTLYTFYLLSKADLLKYKLIKAFDYLMAITIVWVLSSELLHILELSGLKTGYKLGLSILWGVYALLLIGIGIYQNKKHLRIGAIALFAITLLKLFLYDLTSLDTISKVIVFISLGVLLLLISFLYTKYKHLIIDEQKDSN